MSWVLDILFNGRATDEPGLLFKGGTSLSKAYGLISRFSKDIDITVFREDLGLHLEIADLEGLSGKQQRRRLESLNLACKSYVRGPLKERLNRQIGDVFRTHSIAFTTEPGAPGGRIGGAAGQSKEGAFRTQWSDPVGSGT